MTQIVCNLLINVVTVVRVLLSCLFLCTLQGMLSITTTSIYVVVKTLLIIENFSSQMQATEVKFDHTSKPELRFHPRRTSNRETPDLQLGI